MSIDSIITEISSGATHVDVLAKDATEALAIADALRAYWRASRPIGRMVAMSAPDAVACWAFGGGATELVWAVSISHS